MKYIPDPFSPPPMGALSQREELEGTEEKGAWERTEVMPRRVGEWTAKNFKKELKQLGF